MAVYTPPCVLFGSAHPKPMESLASVAMTRSRGRDQERRLTVIDAALPASAAFRWSPDPERVENHRVELPLIGMGQIIGRQGLDADTGRLVEFSISAQITYRGKWSEVARVDTAHEDVHLHVRSRRGLTSTEKYCSLSLDRRTWTKDTTRAKGDFSLIGSVTKGCGDVEPRVQARVVVAHKVMQALRRRDFRTVVSDKAAHGSHVIVPALPDDPMSEFFEQARAAQGTIYIAMMEGKDLSVMSLTKRPAPRHAAPSDDDRCLIYPHTHVAMVFSYLRASRVPLDVVEAPGNLLVDLVDDADQLTPLHG
jgi:hypothetical protein